MAKELLPEQELNEGKYVIVKTLTFGEKGGVYSAKRSEDGVKFALKEMIPNPSLSEAAVAERTQQLQEAMEVLREFDHPGLTRMIDAFSEGRRQYVVLEQVEGITMKTLLDMSVKGQPEPQAIEWGMALCDALHYLHNRPKPFIFDALDPSNIMVTSEGRLKLINFGLDRFLGDEDAPEFSAQASVIARDIRKFGETLFFFLCRREPGPFGASQSDPISPELAKVINRCLSAEDKGLYISFEELKKNLDEVLHPPVQEKVAARKINWGLARFATWSFSWARAWQNLVWSFFKQPLYLVVLELLVAGALLWYVNGRLNPPILAREGAAVYVTCGGKIDVVRRSDMTVLTSIPLPQDRFLAAAATPDGGKLLATTENGFLKLINPRSNRIVGELKIDPGVRKLLVDPSGQLVYLLNSETGTMSVLKLDPTPLPEKSEGRLKREDSVVALVPMGRDAQGIALAAPGETPAASPSPDTSPSPGADDLSGRKLYLSSVQSNEILAVEPYPTVRELFKAPVSGAGALALSASKSNLLVVLPIDGHVQNYRLPGMGDPVKTGLDTGGTRPFAVLVPADGQKLFVANESGTVGELSAVELSLTQTIKIGGKLTDCRLKGDELWVLTEAGELVLVSATSGNIQKRVQVGPGATSITLME